MMDINTPIKLFNKQTSVIMRGNVVASTMIGDTIRPYNDVSAHDPQLRKEGALQLFDLDSIATILIGNGYGNAWQNLRMLCQTRGYHETLHVYIFFHFQLNRKAKHARTIHGAIITNSMHKEVFRMNLGPTYKSHAVLDECAKIVADGHVRD